jgi:hypothetical protein
MRQIALLSVAFLAATLGVAQSLQVAVDPQIQKFSTLLGVDLERLALTLRIEPA